MQWCTIFIFSRRRQAVFIFSRRRRTVADKYNNYKTIHVFFKAIFRKSTKAEDFKMQRYVWPSLIDFSGRFQMLWCTISFSVEGGRLQRTHIIFIKSYMSFNLIYSGKSSKAEDFKVQHYFILSRSCRSQMPFVIIFFCRKTRLLAVLPYLLAFIPLLVVVVVAVFVYINYKFKIFRRRMSHYHQHPILQLWNRPDTSCP